MITEAALRAHVRIEWIHIRRGADDALKRNEIDVFPILGVSKERQADFFMSQPWWQNEIALVSPKFKPLNSAQDTAGKRIAVRDYSSVRALATRLFPSAQQVTVHESPRMIEVLCEGKVDGFFLDLRMIESQLANGIPACTEHPLTIASLPGSSIPLATAVLRSKAKLGARIFEQLDPLAADGTLADVAAHYPFHNPYQASQMREILNTRHRAQLEQYGLAVMGVGLVLILFQNRRIRKAREAAEESRQRFDAFMKYTPAVTLIKDRNGRISYVNDAFCKHAGKTPAEVLGKTQSQIWPESIAKELTGTDSSVLETNASQEWIQVLPSSNGGLSHFFGLKFPFSNSDGTTSLGVVALDITERRKAERALRFSQFSIENASEAVMWIDSAGRISYANEAACASLGYTREEMTSMTMLDVDPNYSWTRLGAGWGKLKQEGAVNFETTHKTHCGELLPVEVTVNYFEFEGDEFTCCLSRDITERKTAESEMVYRAQHDLITGLPNRWRLERELQEQIETAKAHKGTIALLYLDLDGFKYINDTLGHATGDKLLKQVAERLRSRVTKDALLARMAGDEFAIALPGIHGMEEINRAAKGFLQSLQDGFDVDERELILTASIGVSIFPSDGDSVCSLLQTSDAAMYQAKSRGRNQIKFYTPKMGIEARERLELENRLRRALERGNLSLAYQPQVSLSTGDVVGFEALLRWHDPLFGAVPPDKFVPIAEETGLIVPLGAWVLEQACIRAQGWLRSGMSQCTVAVNVSPVQFLGADFVSTVEDILDRTGLPPAFLNLELTETVVMNGIEDVVQKIQRLRSLGIRVSMDDFGTGYSSLSYLQNLPIDSLKVDRSFICDIENDPKGCSFIRAVVLLAHSLGLEVVIEGVETSEQLAIVRETGCDLVQGFLLGMPADVENSLPEPLQVYAASFAGV